MGSCAQLVWDIVVTIRLDATEKVVIRCIKHVCDFQLVDPAVMFLI